MSSIETKNKNILDYILYQTYEENNLTILALKQKLEIVQLIDLNLEKISSVLLEFLETGPNWQSAAEIFKN